MRTAELEPLFRSFLDARRLTDDRITTVPAVTAWVDFYKLQRADDVDEGMDWLWFQFGTYDWGRGPSSQIDLTRQFILSGLEGDDAIWQMHLVLHFPPEWTFGQGIIDCDDPVDADAFLERVLASDVVAHTRNMTPERIELYLENAG